MRFIIVVVCTVLALLVACDDDEGSGSRRNPTVDPPATAAQPTSASTLPVIELGYDGGTLRVEVADTPDDRAQGLGGRDALADDAGMLFDLDENRVPGFWMKGMRFPIDMVWIDETKTVVGVANDVQPQPDVPDAELRRYSPDRPVRYVLEINAGAAQALGIGAGDVLRFELPE